MFVIAEDVIWRNVLAFELARRALHLLYALFRWLYMIIALYLLIKTLLTTLSSVIIFNGASNNLLYYVDTSSGETFAFGMVQV